MAFSELIAIYLFMGGTAAGSFLLITLIDIGEDILSWHRTRSLSLAFCAQRRHVLYLSRSRLVRLVYSVSFVLLLVGMGCLLADLGRPQAFYMLFIYPTYSFVSMGTFALAVFFICLTVALGNSVLELSNRAKRFALILKILGIPLSVFVMVYTGLLLKSVIAVHLWQSVWLPVLFLFSALSCGCGIILLCICFSDNYKGLKYWVRCFSAIDILFVILETLSAVLFLRQIYNLYGIDLLLPVMASDVSYLFWFGFVVCGLIIPIIIEIRSFVISKTLQKSIFCILALFILAGGLCLRIILVYAGV